MSITKQVTKHFKEVFFGGNWTAVNIKDTLKNVTLQQATTKIDSLNTIAVLTYHINYYVEGVLQVLKGGTLDIKDKFSFDVPEFISEEEWQIFLETVFANALTFSQKMETLSDEQIFDFFVDEKYGNYYRNLTGIIEHTHYHLGQITLIKKILNEKD